MKILLAGLCFLSCSVFWSCTESVPLSDADIIGEYVLQQDTESLTGEAAKDAAVFSLLKFEIRFYESHDYVYKHHLGGMMKEIVGKWYLSNDSLFTTNEHNPDVFQLLYLVQNKEENGLRVMRTDSTILHLVRK